jgi:hypothetical protein
MERHVKSAGELATASDKLLSRLMGDMGQLMTELHAEPSMSDGGWGERVAAERHSALVLLRNSRQRPEGLRTVA